MIDTSFTIRFVGALVELNSALSLSFRRLAAGPKLELSPTSSKAGATPEIGTAGNGQDDAAVLSLGTTADASVAIENTILAARLILSGSNEALTVHGRLSRDVDRDYLEFA